MEGEEKTRYQSCKLKVSSRNMTKSSQQRSPGGLGITLIISVNSVHDDLKVWLTIGLNLVSMTWSPLPQSLLFISEECKDCAPCWAYL